MNQRTHQGGVFLCPEGVIILGRPPTISRQVDIHDAEAGEVWVVFAPGETDVSGVYRAEFRVTYGDGRRETFPNDGYISIQILSDLRG